MDLDRLIAALAEPAAYPDPVKTVEVRQTHISVVFLAGDFAYKVKKPVALGFLDFSTLDRRLHFCREEVRLNRRLAPDVYLDVVPVISTPAGPRVAGAGDAIEWAVKMRRLPDAATLAARLRNGDVGPDLIEALARRVAAFHRAADPAPTAGRYEAVAKDIQDVLARAEPYADRVIPTAVFARVRTLFDEQLARRRPLIEARAARGMSRDGHGDLRLDHVYHFPDRPAPGDLVVIDCIEFSDRLRAIDPVADMAFLAMDLAADGRRDLGRAFADAYFAEAGNTDGRDLLPLYTAYRAAVRGMVDELLLAEPEVPAADRERAVRRARAHWLLALGELEAPGRRPCVVLVGGLPGTGKSVLARGLATRAGFAVIRSDVVRKELAGLPVEDPSPPDQRERLYSPEWSARTYAECLHRAEALIRGGCRVLIDASFHAEANRRTFLTAANDWGVPAMLLICQADPATIRARLTARRGDASDAGWDVHQHMAAAWDEPGEATRRVYHSISGDGEPEQVLERAMAVLRREGAWE
jgi:uncharacterized protein